jgi:peptidase E
MLAHQMPPRHIVALGGGGFLMDDPVLDDFILSLGQTLRDRPRVCFLSTASGDKVANIERFHRAFGPKPCVPSHLTLFRREVRDIAAFLGEQDVIYVGGGSTANLLALWRLHGVDRALHAAWQRGAVLAGVSAGANCWFESSITDSFGPQLEPLNDGLGFIRGSVCPHFDGEPLRRPRYLELIAEQRLPPGIAADDYAGLHFVDEALVEVVTSRPRANGYVVNRTGVTVAKPPKLLDSANRG